MEQDVTDGHAPGALVTHEELEDFLSLCDVEDVGEALKVHGDGIARRLAAEVRRLTAAWAEDSRQMQALYEETHAAADAAIRERDEARSTLAQAMVMIAAHRRDFDAIRAAIPGYNNLDKPPVLADAVRALVKERDQARAEVKSIYADLEEMRAKNQRAVTELGNAQGERDAARAAVRKEVADVTLFMQERDHALANANTLADNLSALREKVRLAHKIAGACETVQGLRDAIGALRAAVD